MPTVRRVLEWILICAAPMVVADVESPQASDPVRFIGVLVYEGVLTSDVTGPLEVLGAAVRRPGGLDGYRVVTIAPQSGLVATQEGVRLQPDFTIDDAPELEVLIVGSAYRMDPVLENSALRAFVQARGQRARWLASNCSGARILADAGLLNGRRATTYPGGEIWLKARHPRIDVVFGEPIVIDDHVVTSSGGLISYAAALALLERIAGAELSRAVAEDIYYDRLLAIDND